MTQSGSTPRQEQPTVRRSQPAILIPLNRSWKSEETDELALLTILYIYICRLCVGIRVKGLTLPPLTDRKYDPTSHVPVERKDVELKKCPMKRGMLRSMGATGEGERGEREDRTKEIPDMKD